MKSVVKHPDKKAATGAYSAGIRSGGWLFVSGQGALDLATGRPCPGTIEEETALTMTHVGKILAAAGCTFDDVVRCGCYLADLREFARFNRAYAAFFPGSLPARTTVQAGLGDGLKVEIDCVARIPRKTNAKKRKTA